MNAQAIILLVTQLVPLVTNLAAEIQRAQGLSEADKEALKASVRQMKEKVAAVKWD